MMKKIFILIGLCLCLTSCNHHKKNTIDATPATDTVTIQNVNNSSYYTGVYTGTFPAADCPGIKTTLTLNKDKSFELISEYLEKENAIFKEYGTYIVEDTLLTLTNGDDKQYYAIGENTLTALNQDKQSATQELAPQYILHKK